MARTSDTSTSLGDEAAPPSAFTASSADGARHTPDLAAERTRPGVLRSLSPRVTAALAAVMLVFGVAVGAAIGPAPSSTFAGSSRLPLLLPSLIAAAGVAERPSKPAAQPVGTSAQAPPPAGLASSPGAVASSAPSTASSPSSPASSPTPAGASPSPSPTRTSTGRGAPGRRLPPVSNVWLIQLSGSSFAGALAQPAAAPYIDAQAIGAGTLLSGWSALDGSAFASETALLATAPPQIVDSIVQPPCPEGAAGAQCAAGTPGALSSADEFLKASLPTVTATPAYREHGLIVVTFGSVVSGSASGLPLGSSSATLPSQPPAGVLLISPFASPGARPSIPFNPSSPKQSVEKLLRR